MIISTLLLAFSTLFLFLMKDGFSASFFWFGMAVLVVSFFHLYHVHIRVHFINIGKYAHFREWSHLFLHFKQCFIGIILYVSTTGLLTVLDNPSVEYSLMGLFVLSMLLYYVSLSKGLKKLFEYEEKHLHLIAFVKLFAAALSLTTVTLLADVQLIPKEAAIGIVAFLFMCFLYVFSLSLKMHSRKGEKLFFVFLGVGAGFLAWFLLSGMFSDTVIALCLFSYYYFCWGIFKHFLQRDLTWKRFFEYLLISLLIVALSFGKNIFWGKTL